MASNLENKIISAVQAHFEPVSNQTVVQSEEHYPQTIHSLFETVVHLFSDKWGGSIKEKIALPTPHVSDPHFVLPLLMIETSQFNKVTPEIFFKFQDDPKWVSLLKKLKKIRSKEIQEW